MQAISRPFLFRAYRLFSTIRLFLVEKIHRAFQPDRRERKDRVAEHLEPLGPPCAPCPTTPQHIVDLVAPGEIPAHAEAHPGVVLRSQQFGDILQPLCPRHCGDAYAACRKGARCRPIRPADFPGRSSRPPSSNGRLCPKGSCRSRASAGSAYAPYASARPHRRNAPS